MVALVATLTISLMGGLIYLSSSQNIVSTGISGPTELAVIKRTPIIYSDGCQVGKSATHSPLCEYGDHKGTKTIVLFGDSHAAQWFPALDSIAKKNSMRLVVLTKSSCPAASVTLADQGAFRNAPCETWRANAFTRIAKVHPWAVFVSNFDHYVPPSSVSHRAKWWNAGVKKTAMKLETMAGHSLLIRDTPWPNRDIPSCLSQKTVEKCVTSRPQMEPLIGLPISTLVIDPTDWFCHRACPAIRDGMVVYRDSTHMTVDFALHLEGVLSQILKSDGVISRVG